MTHVLRDTGLFANGFFMGGPMFRYHPMTAIPVKCACNKLGGLRARLYQFLLVAVLFRLRLNGQGDDDPSSSVGMIQARKCPTMGFDNLAGND